MTFQKIAPYLISLAVGGVLFASGVLMGAKVLAGIVTIDPAICWSYVAQQKTAEADLYATEIQRLQGLQEPESVDNGE